MSAPTRHDDANRGNIRRIVWIVFLLVAGLVLAALQLDRESLRRPSLALIVPDAARSFSLPLIVQMDLMSNRADHALASARRLVELRPLPAENLSILAMAAANAGSADLAVGALGLSVGRGWREPLAQAAAARGALDAGETVSAAQRVVALWSIGQRDERVGDLFAEISASEPGRAELARWLKENPAARDGFLLWSAENVPTASAGNTIGSAIAAGVSFDCVKLAYTVSRIIWRGDADASRKMWRGDCAKAGHGPQEIKFLPETSEDAGLFGWKTVNGAGFENSSGADTASSVRRWSLTYDNGNPGRTLIAHRVAILRPGKYRASVASPQTEVSSLPVQMRVSCTAGNGAEEVDIAVITANAPIEFQVPPETCGVQLFRILAPRGQGDVSMMSVSPVR